MKIDNEKQEATAWDESAQQSPTRAIEQLRYDLFDVVLVNESRGSTRKTAVNELQTAFRIVGHEARRILEALEAAYDALPAEPA